MQFLLSRTLLISSLMCAAAPALAVYKCELNGKVTYGDAPCVTGKVVELAEKVTVTAADSTRAQERLAQEKSMVERIEKERARQDVEEEKKRRKAEQIATEKKGKCSSLALKVKWSEEDAAQASSKSSARARTKANRLAEQYRAECQS